MTEQLLFYFSLSCIGEGSGNPLQYSCLENPRDRGAWWAAVYGVAQSWTRLKWRSSSSSSSSNSRQIWSWSKEWSRAKANRVLPGECTGYSKHPLPTTQKTTHGHHQMVNTEIRLIILFATKDGEALYSQQKQDQELTVPQIMNSLLPNSDLNWRK